MPRAELIYDRDCPNVERAREALLEGFRRAGMAARWTEWDSGAPTTPAHARGWGSPTVLVDGRDVEGGAPGEGGSSCRLYAEGAGATRGTPSTERIAEALRAAEAHQSPIAGGRSSLAAVPAVAVAALPKLACPACWPAYAGLVSSAGLGALLETAYLLPLTVAFLALALGSLAFRARSRRGYGPFGAGLAATALVLAGGFALDSGVIMYAGVGLLVAAAAWNAWPRGRSGVPPCPACVPKEGRS